MFISLEDHFASTATRSRDVNIDAFNFDLWPAELMSKLSSLDDIRIKDMDGGDVNLQVVSSLPVAEPLDVCEMTNNQLAEGIRRSQGRLAGLAALPMADGKQAGSELSRCVKELGYLGALVPNHADGKYYDGAEYAALWSEAERLDVPIYLHPCPTTTSRRATFDGEFSDDISRMLSQGGWGWHADVALHVLKLHASGTFDRHPKLKLVLGHSGEMLPFMLYRINSRLTRVCTHLRRPFAEVWLENIWVTISGMWDMASMACLLRSTAIDRIMFSVDYPFESSSTGSRFMQELKESGMVSSEEWDQIAYQNAEALLRTKRPLCRFS